MPVMKEEHNARITSASLGLEGHGLPSSMICWESGGSGGGFGGLHLGGPAMSIWVTRILSLFGYDDWSQLRGTYIRVRTGGLGGQTHAIGHIIEDKWVTIAELQDDMKAAGKG